MSTKGTGGTVTRGNFPRLLEKGLKRLAGDTYADWPEECTLIVDEETSTRAFEIIQFVETTDIAELKDEGDDVKFTSFTQSFSPTWEHNVWGLAYAATREAVEDEQYNYLKKGVRNLAKAIRQIEEVEAANLLNFDVVTTALMKNGDGVPLIDAAHPLGPSGDTFSNKLATSAALSEASIESLTIQIGKAVDSKGLQIALRPQRLIVPVDQQYAAHRIKNSVLQNNTMNNATNALKDMNILPDPTLVSHFVTSSVKWWIKTDADDGLIRYNRRAVEFSNDSEFMNENFRYKATRRFSDGWGDPRALYAGNS